MPKGLRRIHGGGDNHFITCSCYQRRPSLDPPQRDLFLTTLEEVRQKYKFIVYGYVVMPEHFHLLIGEPESGSLSVVMQVLKQKVTKKCLHALVPFKDSPFTKNVKGGAPEERDGLSDDIDWALNGKNRVSVFWQKRYYDFNVFSEKKHVEKLRYIHRNPVTRGLVESPELWIWSSFREYSIGERGPVKIK